MKPAQIEAERERRAKAAMRKMARAIPDNEVLAKMLLRMERPLRKDFYRVVTPHLKFTPIRLEILDANA